MISLITLMNLLSFKDYVIFNCTEVRGALLNILAFSKESMIGVLEEIINMCKEKNYKLGGVHMFSDCVLICLRDVSLFPISEKLLYVTIYLLEDRNILKFIDSLNTDEERCYYDGNKMYYSNFSEFALFKKTQVIRRVNRKISAKDITRLISNGFKLTLDFWKDYVQYLNKSGLKAIETAKALKKVEYNDNSTEDNISLNFHVNIERQHVHPHFYGQFKKTLDNSHILFDVFPEAEIIKNSISKFRNIEDCHRLHIYSTEIYDPKNEKILNETLKNLTTFTKEIINPVQ
jgi:hypothetical protein